MVPLFVGKRVITPVLGIMGPAGSRVQAQRRRAEIKGSGHGVGLCSGSSYPPEGALSLSLSNPLLIQRPLAE